MSGGGHSSVISASHGSSRKPTDALSRLNVLSTVFVSRLPKLTRASDIATFFASSRPKNVEVGGAMCTYAFVEFDSPRSAESVCAAFHNAPFPGANGTRVAVQAANSLSRLFVGGITSSSDAAGIFTALAVTDSSHKETVRARARAAAHSAAAVRGAHGIK